MLLLALQCLVLDQYSLKGPFQYNTTGNLGSWTLVGNGAVMRNSVRFTGNEDGTSQLCQRIPTVFHSWQIRVNASFHMPRQSDSSLMCASFSREFCLDPDEEEVISVCVTSPLGNKQKVYLLTGLRDGEPLCNITENPNTVLSVVRRDHQITVVDENTGEVCGTKELEAPVVVFFSASIYGLSPSFYADINEITVANLSEAWTFDSDELDQFNQKSLSQRIRKRQRMKRSRRAKMEAIGVYLNQQDDLNQTLDGNGDLQDVFVQIAEMQERADETLSVWGLDVAINAAMDRSIKHAKADLDATAAKLEDVRLQHLGLINTVKTRTGTIRQKFQQRLDYIRDDVLKMVRDESKSNKLNSMLVKSAIKQKLEIHDTNPIKYIYIGIVITECRGFIAFTIYKRKVTRAFTKRD